MLGLLLRIERELFALKNKRKLSVLGVGIFAALSFAHGVLAANFTVTKTADTNDGACDATDCSLREAISAANAAPGLDIISLPGGTYVLQLANPGGIQENANATGDLDITGDLEIIGAGANTTTVDGARLDRVIQVESSTVRLIGFTITGGEAPFGGGIFSHGSTLTLDRMTVHGNKAIVVAGSCNTSGCPSAPGAGGGISSSFIGSTSVPAGIGELILNNSTVSGNSATQGGGIDSNSVVAISNSTITGNTAQHAAGIRLTVDHGTISSSTISGNTASGNTGGVAQFSGGPAGTVEIKNSIVADNAAGTNPNCFRIPLYPMISLGGNVGNDTSCGTGPGDKVVTSAMLAPLANNGGPTQTMLPLAGSPAIDALNSPADCNDPAGAPVSTDQRGHSRNPPPGGACESGAVEVDAPPPAISHFNIYKSIGSLSLPPAGVSGTAVSFTVWCSDGYAHTWSFRVGMAAANNNQAIGTTCVFTETVLPPPFTNASGELCTWQMPAPQVVTLTNQPYQSVTLVNSYTCVPTGTLSIYKLILDPSGIPLVLAGPWGLSAPTFNIRANCGGQGPGSVALTPPILAGSISNLSYGTSCTIDEPALPAPFTNSAGDTCTWQQSAPLTQTIPINGPAQAVTVTNTFTCAPPASAGTSSSPTTGAQATGTLTITKTTDIDSVKNSWQGPFPVTVSCVPASGGAPQTYSTTLTSPYPDSKVVGPIPVGSACTVTETPPATNWPSPQRWAIDYSPSANVTIAAGNQTVNILNEKVWSNVSAPTDAEFYVEATFFKPSWGFVDDMDINVALDVSCGTTPQTTGVLQQTLTLGPGNPTGTRYHRSFSLPAGTSCAVTPQAAPSLATSAKYGSCSWSGTPTVTRAQPTVLLKAQRQYVQTVRYMLTCPNN